MYVQFIISSRILTILVFVYFRWKSGRKCRSDGNDELKSWIGHKNEIEETRGEENKTETNAETTRSNQEQTEPNAGITRSEVLHSQPQHSSGVRY